MPLFAAQFANDARQFPVNSAGPAETAERIGLVRVEAGRDDDQTRTEFSESIGQFRAKRGEHGFVAAAFGQRDVEIEPFALARAGVFRRAARARVKRILVRGKIKYRRILVSHHLRPVAVVHVPIDDHDALDAVFFPRVTRGDGCVAEKTKSLGRLGHGVVSGRTHRGEGISRAPVHHGVDRGERGADRAHSCVPRSRGDRAVWTVAHESLAVPAGGAQSFDVIRIMQCRDPRQRIDAVIRCHAQQTL